MNAHRPFLLLVLFALASTAAARPFVDQQAPYGTATIVAGNDAGHNIIVAQTVTAGLTGDLMRIELGVGCDGGTLVIEIVSLEPGRPVPGSVVRARAMIDAASLSSIPALHTFDLDTHPSMTAGDRFAIVVRNETGSCKLLKGPEALDGSSYRGGEGYFRRADGSPGAWFQFLDFGRTGDLGFKTIVNVPASSPPCTVNGFATPFPGFLPVCRCIEDEGLRDFRCALMDPSFFAFRNIPMPIRAGKAFTVKWTLVIAAPMPGVVEVMDVLPQGFSGGLKSPLTFFVDQVPAGQSITLQYDAVAPMKAGRYKIETSIGDGRMQTMIEVLP